MRDAIYREIEAERAHQIDRWGTNADDTRNYPNDWAAYIAHYAMRWFPNGFPPYEPEAVDAFRESMVKVATLAVAAIESLDRQSQRNGKPFYATDECAVEGMPTDQDVDPNKLAAR